MSMLLIAAPGERERTISLEKQVAVLVRAMSFDRALKARAGPRVDVIVLYARGDPASAEMAKNATLAFALLEGVSVQGLPLAATSVGIADEQSLAEALSGHTADAVYVCRGLEGLVGALRREAARRGVLTIGSTSAYVDAGLALGLDTAGAKPTLVVNLVQARAERVDFASEMLKLARVIR